MCMPGAFQLKNSLLKTSIYVHLLYCFEDYVISIVC